MLSSGLAMLWTRLHSCEDTMHCLRQRWRLLSIT